MEMRIIVLKGVRRQIGTGGESPVSWDVLCGHQKLPDVKLKYLSFYGATELSVWSCVQYLSMQSNDGLRLIGKNFR
jgi:hypothetical protein